MKRIGMFALPVLGLLLGATTPASAHGWGGGGHAAPVAHAGGGWRGAVVNRPMAVPHVAVAPRSYVGRPGYGARGGYLAHPGYAARPGYVGRADRGFGVGPVAGAWGWRGGTRVWIGASTAMPYPGWYWTPGSWVWNGGQWVWQDGYWAPPAY